MGPEKILQCVWQEVIHEKAYPEPINLSSASFSLCSVAGSIFGMFGVCLECCTCPHAVALEGYIFLNKI